VQRAEISTKSPPTQIYVRTTWNPRVYGLTNSQRNTVVAEKIKPITELRSELAVIVRDLADEDLSTREISDRFIKKKISLCHAAQMDLYRMAVVQLVNQVSHRRPRATLVPGQGDLFAGYGIPSIVAVKPKAPGKTRSVRRKATTLTYAEAQAWVRAHSQVRDELSREVAEMNRLLRDVKPYITSPQDTLEEALASRAAEKEQQETNASGPPKS
jgi:hypothetical protein